MDQNSQLTGSAAVDEIKRIQEDSSHPDYAKYAASDPATIRKVSELWRSTENGESADPQPAAEPAKEPAKEDTPEATGEDQEAADKKMGQRTAPDHVG